MISTNTLKKQYDRKQLQTIHERVQGIDTQLLNEQTTSRLLLEAMNDDDLKKASAIIDKLRSVKGKGLKHLDNAISTAEAELNKYTGGGPLVKAWSKIKNKVGIDNPLVKILTFANALEQGFKQLPIIIKNNVGQLTPDMDEKTLTELIPDEDKKQVLINNMLKALSPKGIFGVFKKVPYADKETLVNDLMSVPIKNLNIVVRQTTAGPQSDQIAGDIKDTATAQGSVETKNATPAAAPVGSEPPTPGSVPKGTTAGTPSTPAGQKPMRPNTGNGDIIAKKVYDDIEGDFADLGIDQKTIMSIIKTLADNGKIKT